VGRGYSFASTAADVPAMELVALCDRRQKALERAVAALAREGRKVTAYTDYDRFLEHDMDAVVVANYFHQHAPFAIKALKAAKHVMSECLPCFTLAEGVKLVEEVERSGKIYMFAENCPYFAYNQEMRRLYKSGLIGEFKYGEGEYVHPMSAESVNALGPGPNHWRNWIPATYYSTHSLAPIMVITDTMPVRVNGFVIPYDPDDEQHFGKTVRRNDTASVIILRMDNGAVVKLLQWSLRGHGLWYRIHGNRGLMENLRCGDQQMLRVRREPFDKKRGEPVERIYTPDFPTHHQKAARTGHGGADFFMNHLFAQAIRKGEQPYLDVYRGVAMSAVAILAYRSALEDSRTFEVPDFRDRKVRARYADDDWNPDPERRREGYPWPSVLGDITPPAQGLAFARKVWKAHGLEVEK